MDDLFVWESALEFLTDCKLPVRIAIVSSCDDKLILTLVACCLNLLNRNIRVTSDEIAHLSKYSKELHQLADTSHTLQKKRQLLRGKRYAEILPHVLRMCLRSLHNGELE